MTRLDSHVKLYIEYSSLPPFELSRSISQLSRFNVPTRASISSWSIKRFVLRAASVSKHLKMSLALRHPEYFAMTVSMYRFSFWSCRVRVRCVSVPPVVLVSDILMQLTTSPKLGLPLRDGNNFTNDEWKDSQRLFVRLESRCAHHISGGNRRDKNVLEKLSQTAPRPHAFIFAANRLLTASTCSGVRNANWTRSEQRHLAFGTVLYVYQHLFRTFL